MDDANDAIDRLDAELDDYVRRGEVVHVAGPCITFAGRWVRQRCVWCGHVLIDMDLARTLVELPADGSEPDHPKGWADDALVHVDGGMSWVDPADDNDEGRVPDRCCMRLDPAVPAEGRS
jgi:hypothetical protein